MRNSAVHLYHPLSSLPLLIQPCTPPNWASMALNPNNNQPPISTSHTKPHPNPQEAPAQMNGLLCIQNTWHPPSKIIIMEEPFDPRSILSYNHWLHLPTSKTHMKTDLFSVHQNFHDPQHTQIHAKFHLINTSTPHYPLQCPNPPLTHTHPNPHQAPNSELVWPLPSPPANPRPTPLAETMATGWEWEGKEDGWTGGLTTKQHASHLLTRLFPHLLSFLI